MSAPSRDTVLIEALPGGRFRASEKTQFGDLSAEGTTEAEAARNLNYLELQRMEAEGLVILPARYQEGAPARRRSAPFREDDPMIQEWLAEIARNRAREDAEDERE